MNKSTIKYLLVAGFVVVCGLSWLFWEKGNHSSEITKSPIYESATEGEQTGEPVKEAEKKIYIHIVGAVKKPGVYTFENEPRVIEVVKAAGGFTKQAVRSGVNQAELVSDGVQIVIESKKDQNAKQAEEGRQEHSTKLDLNTATKEELMTLPGIGESKAMAILSHRETNGRFRSIEDIMNITGIKNGVFDKIKDFIRV